MRVIRHFQLSILAVLFALALSSGIASAQSSGVQPFPSKPLTMYYPFTPGSATEGLFRGMAAEWSKSLGQPVVFENRPGAGGRLGLLAIVKMRGDGHYLTTINSSIGTLLPLVESTNF